MPITAAFAPSQKGVASSEYEIANPCRVAPLPRPIRGPKRLLLTAKSVSHKVMVSQSCLWFQHCSPLRD